jgi:transcriptional regulator with XRE-family HTH domain
MAISASYVADIELGNKVVSERVIKLLCAEYNVDSHWLRTGDGSMFNEDMDADNAKVLSTFKSLSKPLKACALKQLDELSTLQREILK